ncbi:histone H2A deubiquitinase MYSM1 [Brienomyrus brachyistius]|uniref:histone H2A deubiquitinase MYSM1 n=1 Tax=Brienomyrus brachyistius TaxID=42636 RepID=UPI0020B26908|nr:histone H2A deubiquitinase MYSM1 [Brienomyrus brachyistius]
MADEVELVDIEGDVTDVNLGDAEGREIIQDPYLQSAWKNSNGLLPWTLDSSISAENREAIENMLLEEEYYLAGKELPKSMWAGEKQKVKRSPVKPSAQPVRWAEEEKELFEAGLSQFGRRWTKISKLIGSRTVLQVKSYARQYFKKQTKLENSPHKSPGAPCGSVGRPPPGAAGSVKDHSTMLSNAVRIERLSDDEDVDITDDLDDEPLLSSQGEPVEQGPSEDAAVQSVEPLPAPSPRPCCSVELTPEAASEVVGEGVAHAHCDPTSAEETDPQPAGPGSADGGSASEREDSSGAGPAEGSTSLDDEYEEEDEEEEELKAPEQEVQLDRRAVTEEEKQAVSEFFEGRPSKTPERYLKIRNYILEQWEKVKPKYLNKTSVRPGLRNCGDVNCIGRIHTYLELIGAINFGCEQAVYNRPRMVERSRAREGRDALEAYQLAQRLQSMRARKRRVRDMWGNWCDAKDLEGQTFEHLSAEDLAKRREDSCKRQLKASKASRQRSSFDPFQLIPCQEFGDEKQEPFRVAVCAEALIIMDMHSHVSMGEVIGLLGGEYNEAGKVLKICAAEPCTSLSTGMQCEMDPVSQTQASEQLAGRGYDVVGWYHSHPAFDPNPSLRDIDTQAKFQGYFSRGGAPFIGMIVSPYNPSNTSPHSQTTCLVVSEEQGPAGSHRIPFKFEIHELCEEPNWVQVMKRAEWIVKKYRASHSCVPMDRFFRRDSDLTCLDKMLASLRKFLEQLQDSTVEQFLSQVETLFLLEISANQKSDRGDSPTLKRQGQSDDSIAFSAAPSDGDGFYAPSPTLEGAGAEEPASEDGVSCDVAASVGGV